jgi:hypothetical protein
MLVSSQGSLKVEEQGKPMELLLTSDDRNYLFESYLFIPTSTVAQMGFY